MSLSALKKEKKKKIDNSGTEVTKLSLISEIIFLCEVLQNS